MHTADGCDLESAEGRAKHLAQALPLLNQMPPGLLRDQILQDLAQQVRAPIEQVQQRLAQQGSHRVAGNATEAGMPAGATPSGQQVRLRREGGGWGRQSRPAHRPILLQAASPLERAAWLLMHRSDIWEQLPPDVHDLLCEQAMPLGAFFSALDRLIADQGPVQAQAIEHTLMAGSEPDPAMQSLLHRLRQMHAVLGGQESAQDVIALLRPIRLQALSDELDLLLSSGELSPQAEQRRNELIHETRRLKQDITRENTSTSGI